MSARRSATVLWIAIFAGWLTGPLVAFEIELLIDPQQFGESTHPWTALWTPELVANSNELPGRTPFVALAAAVDGKKIATVDQHSIIRLYDAANFSRARKLDASKHQVANLTFSPDGNRLVTVGLDAAITIWNLESGTPESEVTGAQGWILGVAFAPSGQYFVTAGYNRKLQVWEATTGKELTALNADSAIRDVAFSHDGMRLLAGCVDGEVRAWHTNDWTQVKELPKLFAPVNAVSFSPDDSCFATGGDNGEVRLWETADTRKFAALSHHSSQITKLVFSPGGKTLFSCAANGDVAVWDVARRKMLQSFSQHRDEITGLAWLPRHRAIATVSADGTQHVRFAFIPPTIVQALGETVATWTALSRDGQLLVNTDGNSEIRLNELAGDKNTRTIKTTPIRCMTVSAENHLLAAGIDRRIREWDLKTAALVSESSTLNNDVECLAVSNDSRQLVIGTTNHTIQFVDVSAMDHPIVRWTSPTQTLSISCVAFSPDGKLVATATRDPLNWRAGGEVKLWDPETGAELANLGLHSGEVLGICFDNDGKRLASFGSFYDVRLWNVAARKELPRIPIQGNVVGAVFTHDNRILLAQGNGPVSIWSIQRLMPTHEFDGHKTTVAALVASHDRKLVVTRDVANQAKIWKVPDE